MRIDPAQHSWRFNEIGADFELIDAWALPAEGSRSDFDDLVEIFIHLNPRHQGGPTRMLFAVRGWLGRRFSWDDSVNTLPIPGCQESSLRQRLPPDLPAAKVEAPDDSPFRPVFLVDDEYATEISNNLLHAVLHVGWMPSASGTYSGQLGIYVKHRGRLGRAYMAAIAPFRNHIVYPALLRRIGRVWESR